MTSYDRYRYIVKFKICLTIHLLSTRTRFLRMCFQVIHIIITISRIILLKFRLLVLYKTKLKGCQKKFLIIETCLNCTRVIVDVCNDKQHKKDMTVIFRRYELYDCIFLPKTPQCISYSRYNQKIFLTKFYNFVWVIDL